jgi:hypothetical protein
MAGDQGTGPALAADAVVRLSPTLAYAVSPRKASIVASVWRV